MLDDYINKGVICFQDQLLYQLIQKLLLSKLSGYDQAALVLLLVVLYLTALSTLEFREFPWLMCSPNWCLSSGQNVARLDVALKSVGNVSPLKKPRVWVCSRISPSLCRRRSSCSSCHPLFHRFCSICSRSRTTTSSFATSSARSTSTLSKRRTFRLPGTATFWISVLVCWIHWRRTGLTRPLAPTTTSARIWR